MGFVFSTNRLVMHYATIYCYCLHSHINENTHNVVLSPCVKTQSFTGKQKAVSKKKCLEFRGVSSQIRDGSFNLTITLELQPYRAAVSADLLWFTLNQ